MSLAFFPLDASPVMMSCSFSRFSESMADSVLEPEPEPSLRAASSWASAGFILRSAWSWSGGRLSIAFLRSACGSADLPLSTSLIFFLFDFFFLDDVVAAEAPLSCSAPAPPSSSPSSSSSSSSDSTAGCFPAATAEALASSSLPGSAGFGLSGILSFCVMDEGTGLRERDYKRDGSQTRRGLLWSVAPLKYLPGAKSCAQYAATDSAARLRPRCGPVPQCGAAAETRNKPH